MINNALSDIETPIDEIEIGKVVSALYNLKTLFS